MKKVFINCSLAMGLVIFFTIGLFAQNNPIELTEQDKEKITEAEDFVSKADDIMDKARGEDEILNDMFSNKSQKEKAEKRSIDAKKLKVEAAVLYQKALGIKYDLYTQKMKNMVFVDKDDEVEFKTLSKQAILKYKSLSSKISRYEKLSTGDLKDKKYKIVCKDLDFAKDSCNLAFSMVEKPYNICLSQKDKATGKEKVNSEKEKLAKLEEEIWNYTQKDKSYYAYNDYIKTFPNGKFINFAKLTTEDFTDQDKAVKRKMYKVILMSKKKEPIPDETLSKICPLCKFTKDETNNPIWYIVDEQFPNLQKAVDKGMSFDFSELIRAEYTYTIGFLDTNSKLNLLE
jgi:hypothetical protein